MSASSTLPSIGLSVNLPLDTILQVVILLTLAAYIIFSVILHYHWVQYSANRSMMLITFVIYAVTTAPLMIALGLITLAI